VAATPPATTAAVAAEATTSTKGPALKTKGRVRLIGLQAKRSLNGTEGTLGDWDLTAQRWEFRAGQVAIKVRSSNVECIRYTSKKRLAEKFFHAATNFGYSDMVANDYVFHSLCDLAANTTEGVNLLFEQMCSDERMFDTLYQGSLK